jgi:hypothetical protein
MSVVTRTVLQTSPVLNLRNLTKSAPSHPRTFVYAIYAINYITDSLFTTKTLKFAAAGSPNVMSTLYVPGDGNEY